MALVEIFLLEQLVAFEKHGTLTRAAEALHITQPALSRSMQKLESLFGVALFERAKSKITLNETGKVAAKYAQRALDANAEMVEQTVAYDRSRRTIVLGACSSLPISLLMPVIQDHFGRMTITSEIATTDRLVQGLRNHAYQLIVVPAPPQGDDVCFQRYMDERLAISMPPDHPLAKRTEVSFAELDGMSILAHGNAMHWMEICQRRLPTSKLLAHDDLEVLHELVDSSTLPAFSSDRAIEYGYEAENRVIIPIGDGDAYTTFYIACLQAEKARYDQVFSAVRSFVIRRK